MPVLDRQPIGHARSSDRIPETAPTPLQKHYINLSAIALVAGAIAITALEAGIPMSSPLVKLCVARSAPRSSSSRPPTRRSASGAAPGPGCRSTAAAALFRLRGPRPRSSGSAS